MIDVIWYDAARGNWDAGLLMSIFDRHPDKFIQHNTKTPPAPEKAIVILVGKPDVKRVRTYLEKIKSGIVILTSDEDSFFDWKAAIPSRFDIWTQYYAPNKSEIKTRLLLGAPSRIKDFNTEPIIYYAASEKEYLWSFIGQVQNPHREKCIEVLRSLGESEKLENGAEIIGDKPSQGYLKVVNGFSGTLGGEVEYQEYLDILRQSRFAICPSGSMCCDTFRVYEAMECGALPIADERCPRDKKDFNYWHSVLTPRLSWIIDLSDWSQLPTYFEFYHGAKRQGYYTNNNEWWQQYKQDLKRKLIDYAAH